MNFKIVLLLFSVTLVYVQSATIEEEVINSTSFTLDFYRSSFDANKNTVVSPISFRILLSLLYQSTIGDTNQELKNHVYFADDKRETAESQLLSVNSLNANPNVKIVNKLYVKKGYKLKQSFETSARNYHSTVEYKDFTKSQQTADEINEFVENQTNGFIKDLVSSKSLNSSTELLLLSTLYFKADWLNIFSGMQFRQHGFNGFDGETKLMDFMVDTRSYKTFKCPVCNSTIIELPYVEESNAKFMIFLPPKDSDIIKIKNRLKPRMFKILTEKLAYTYNEIWIPKFEIETEVDGVMELRKLGLNSMFDKTEIQAIQGDFNLHASEVKQKVKIIVNTQGTEEATPSFAEPTDISEISQSPLIVDRPFIYLILTVDTNEPLFIGHFSKP